MDDTTRRPVALFDVGGVVIRTPFELHDESWRGPFDPAGDELWRQSQAGEITEREYWRRRSAALHPDSEDPTHDFMRTLYEREESEIVRPEVRALLADLTALQVQVAALSNDLAAFHPPEWIARMTVVDVFDPLIDLSHQGVLKPSPEAFELATQKLGAAPRDVVLLDDQEPNVAGARRAGLVAVWFDVTDVEGSVDRMRTALGV